MARTSIEWTTDTWNPVTGCTAVSAGCDHCYAHRFSERFRGVAGHPFETGFDLTLRPERLEQPLHWRKPRMIFVGSMTDVFQKDIPAPFVDRIFTTMERADWHVYQVLSKRSSRLRDYINARYGTAGAPAHIWCGVSVEDRARLVRLRHLQATRAAVRFLSLEPLIEDLGPLDLTGIAWAIVGGESGPGARPMHPDWARSLRDQAKAANVPFFMKQMSRRAPIPDDLMIREWPGE